LTGADFKPRHAAGGAKPVWKDRDADGGSSNGDRNRNKDRHTEDDHSGASTSEKNTGSEREGRKSSPRDSSPSRVTMGEAHRYESANGGEVNGPRELSLLKVPTKSEMVGTTEQHHGGLSTLMGATATTNPRAPLVDNTKPADNRFIQSLQLGDLSGRSAGQLLQNAAAPVGGPHNLFARWAVPENGELDTSISLRFCLNVNLFILSATSKYRVKTIEFTYR
jgi:hypothetical protein